MLPLEAGATLGWRNGGGWGHSLPRGAHVDNQLFLLFPRKAFWGRLSRPLAIDLAGGNIKEGRGDSEVGWLVNAVLDLMTSQQL